MVRGADGTPLPAESIVFRMAHPNRLTEGVTGSGAFAAAFELSDTDKAHSPPYLSVYEESLTTYDEARQLTHGKNLVLRLPVVEVCSVRQPAPATGSLAVCWFDSLLDEGGFSVPDARPGAGGHCGITGLARPPEFPRTAWKTVRVRLADIAARNGPVKL